MSTSELLTSLLTNLWFACVNKWAVDILINSPVIGLCWQVNCSPTYQLTYGLSTGDQFSYLLTDLQFACVSTDELLTLIDWPAVCLRVDGRTVDTYWLTCGLPACRRANCWHSSWWTAACRRSPDTPWSRSDLASPCSSSGARRTVPELANKTRPTSLNSKHKHKHLPIELLLQLR